MSQQGTRPGRSCGWAPGPFFLALALLVGLAGPASAQTPGLTLAVTTNQGVYFPGETLTFSAGASNPGLALAVNFYAGLLAPDGLTLATAGPDGALTLGRVTDLATLRPLATNVNLATAFSVPPAARFRYLWTGAEPFGAYTAFLVAVRAGSLADGRLDPGNLVGLLTEPFNLAPPLQPVPEPPQATTATIPPEGGTLTATSATGVTYTLTIPPGALVQPTTITLTPLASIGGLPGASGLLGAVRAEPDGLRFRLPATLAITAPAGVALPGVFLGFAARGDGTHLELLRPQPGGTTRTLSVTHFSVLGDLGVLPDNLPEILASQQMEASLGATIAARDLSILLAQERAGTLTGDALLAAVLQVLRDWFDNFLIVSLNAAVLDEERVDRAAQELLRWEFFYVLFFGENVMGQPFPTTGPLRAQLRRGFELLLEAIRHAILRFNARCVAEHDTRYVDRVLDMERYGVLLFSRDELQDEFAPATTDQTLCVQSRITAVEFPDTIPPDSPTPLVVQVGAFFTDGVPVPAAENQVLVEVSASGLDSVSPSEQTVPGPGPATAMVTPAAGSTAVTLNIRTAWKGLFKGESREVAACVGPAALPARAPVPRQADGQCVDQPPPTNDPCPDGCRFSGIHAFTERRTDTGQQTVFTSCTSGEPGCSGNPVAVTGGSGVPGRNGAISFVCSTGSVVRIDITLSGGSFTGQVGIVQGCMPSLTPVTGTLSAQGLTFTIDETAPGNLFERLRTFESTGVLAAPSP